MKNKLFDQNNATYQSKLALKNGIKQIMNSQKDVVIKVFPLSLSMMQTPATGSKHVKKIFFSFAMYLTGLYLLFNITFKKKNPINDQFEHFVFRPP